MNTRTLVLLSSVFLLCTLVLHGGSQEEGDRGYRSDVASIRRGQQLFDQYCAACHSFETAEIGPNLAGVTADRSRTWLASFIRNAPEMIARGDERAVELHRQYKQVMPPFTTLSNEDVEQLLAYIHTFAAGAAVASNRKAGALLDPIPEKIPASGLTLVLERVLTFPPTSDTPPATRINKLLAVGGGADERLFVHDLRGQLYEIRNRKPTVFLDVGARLSRFIHVPGLGTGFGSFAFHPDFARNGLLYTTHTEPAGAAPADFAIPASIPTRLQWVLLEWQTDVTPSSGFSREPRELLRADMYSQIHGFQELTFNPRAKPGDVDYGLLYLAVGDGGAGVTKYWSACCGSGIWGTVLRIDPAGRNSRNGRYGVPADNPFAAGSKLPPEVWARGFRNPHRIAWDLTGSGKMFITNIGQGAIEEVNLGKPGAHYGWPEREGTFLMEVPAHPNVVYPLHARDTAFSDPVAQYDHDEGNAISGGYVYAGDRIPALRGKYVFGDITSGRVFFSDVDRMEQGRQAPIHELSIEVAGATTTLEALTKNTRVDLRFGQDSRGELYIFTKADGALYKVVDCRKRS